MAIKFGELRKYLSRVVRLSICFQDGHYDNYVMISDIPEGKYDNLYVYGIGMVDVEFPLDVYGEPKEVSPKISSKDGFFLGSALEIVVTEEAREISRTTKKDLQFGDLRGYLQCGKNFTIVTREEWECEKYEWRDEIPESYNDRYVYGIGLEDDPKAFLEMGNYRLMDSLHTKRLRVVVSEEPKVVSYDKGKRD